MTEKDARPEFRSCRDKLPKDETGTRAISPGCCLPGTTASGAICPGGRCLANHPILTASGSAKSCCSRPPSRRFFPATPLSCANGPTSRRSPRPSLAKCSRPGPGSATTRGRGICMPAPRKLPGIGGYTAAAIAAIAFGARATPVDGNIERAVARLFAVTTPLPESKAKIKALAERLTPQAGSGDFAQAMMDLGATICTPRRPACGLCPVRRHCRGFAEGLAGALPYRQARPARPIRRGAAFVALRSDGAVLLRERPPRGLLGGMLETPCSPWEEGRPNGKSLVEHAPLRANWRKLPGLVAHTFTHFHLELSVYRAQVGLKARPKRAAEPGLCGFVARRDLARAALPSVMRKVLNHAFEAEAPQSTKAMAGRQASPARPRARRRSA